jgi:hypothetical protein
MIEVSKRFLSDVILLHRAISFSRKRPRRMFQWSLCKSNAVTPEQIKDEIRKLHLIGKSEIHRSFDEEAAVDLLLKPGNPDWIGDQSTK